MDLPWRRATIRGYVARARRQIEEVPARERYFCGFSLGAMCLLDAANDLRPRAQLLCSLMPLYEEDRGVIPWWLSVWVWRVYMGRRRMTYPVPDGAWPRTVFVYGSEERRIIGPRVRAARAARFPRSETVEVPGASHDIGDPAYLDQVLRTIGEL